MTERPLCFVLMPLGFSTDVRGIQIDFDDVYRTLIEPAIRVAGLEPLRADDDVTGGIIHKSTFERLLLCDYAVADLTTANANVFYQLGARHCLRPNATFLLHAERHRLPFDVSMMRTVAYRLDKSGRPSDSGFQARLVAALQTAGTSTVDSPVYQLIEGILAPEVSHLKTDRFRERVEHSKRVKEQLEDARRQGPHALLGFESELGDIQNVEPGIAIDLFLSYRAVMAWDRMIALVAEMPISLRTTVMVQEQLAFCLNRTGNREEAERVLLQLIDARGPGSETYGLLGRVYKDGWEAATRQGDGMFARELLDKAIEAYVNAFEADLRDFYPGLNAVMLMALRTPPDPRLEQFLPVVRFAIERKIASGRADYWDSATMLELAVLANDERTAMAALANAVDAIREPWEPETTLRNLRLIREAREAREARDEVLPWMKQVEEELMQRARVATR